MYRVLFVPSVTYGMQRVRDTVMSVSLYLSYPLRKMFLVFTSETDGVERRSKPVCASTILVKDNKTREEKTWCNTDAPHVTRDVADALVSYLYEHASAGIPIITFNGTGFHFRQLELVTTDKDKLELLALMTHDIFLDFATENGYYASMNSFIQGCNLPGKGSCTSTWTDGMGQTAIIQHSLRVANALCNLVQYLETHEQVIRLSKAGKRTLWTPRGHLFRVAHKCITEYEANPIRASWLSNAPNVTELWSWM